MDEEKIEQLGITPIAKDLAAAASFKTADEFFQILGELESRGASGLFYSYVSTDNKNSSKNIVYLGQSGLSLPDEAYYREGEYQEVRDAFLLHVEKIFELAKLPNGKAAAKEVLELETQIAACHWDQVKDRDAEATYNKKSFTELTSLAPAFNWQLWITASNTPAHVLEQVVVRQPSYFEGLSKLIESFDLDKWRSWLTWHIISGASPYLNKALVDENFNFYGTTLSGIPKLKERWKRAVGLVEGALGEAVGQIYVDRHFGKRAKERMVGLVANLIEAYRVDIKALTWMSDETKEKAFIKLDKFTPKIGYPDKWRDYSKLIINPGDLIGNLAQISKYSQDYEYDKIGKPVDKSEWYMTPQTVNAYYNPGMNEIVFPAAILQPPFFDVLADDDAANYGGIGAVIGHEIGHGFDDQGSKYDGDGNLVNWWSDKDRAEFEKRTKKLIEQYDQLSPSAAPEVKVNGALTIGENIGDLGGLTIAYKAYEISLNGKKSPEIDGYTGAQRFFMGWAQSWRGKYRPEEVKRRIATDPHSPDEFRCNQIVANLSEFYDAFAVKQSDKHFMPEGQRVRIW
jgi:putative endopeptidase